MATRKGINIISGNYVVHDNFYALFIYTEYMYFVF